ncbi:MAG: hypothetical protein VKL20_06280 [Synechocystis sp.]|nr:hypothetical protein [Synechocystis sp.]
MSDHDRFADTKLIRLRFCLYLLPIAGIVPSLWQLQQTPQTGVERRQYRLSQRSLQLTLGWLMLYGLLWGGSSLLGDVNGLRLLYLNGLLTSGYFLVCLGWMARIFFQPPPPETDDRKGGWS